MIKRKAEIELKKLAKQFKAIAVVGPRQSGKTTLVKHVFPDKPYVSLETPDVRRFVLEDPKGFLAQYPNGAIIDEAQRAPELFSYLQEKLDNNKTTGQFIITGSNNFLLQESISQSLAGRIAYLFLLPFSLSELSTTHIANVNNCIFKGFYPPVYDQPVEAAKWYPNYIHTYIERDVRQIKNISDLNTFERFLKLCAGRIGQLLNTSNLALETGVDHKTIASWLSILENSFIIYRLQPHYKNFNKRLVKMPKLYFHDTGLACSLMGIKNTDQLLYHPFLGSLFENMIVSELLKYKYNNGQNPDLFFWRDSTGHEIDVLLDSGTSLLPIEIKLGKTISPDFFKGLENWVKISGTNNAALIYGGDSNQKRSNGFDVFAWNKMNDLFKK